jgi:hypothetical protein
MDVENCQVPGFPLALSKEDIKCDFDDFEVSTAEPTDISR